MVKQPTSVHKESKSYYQQKRELDRDEQQKEQQKQFNQVRREKRDKEFNELIMLATGCSKYEAYVSLQEYGDSLSAIEKLGPIY